ncbi:MAG TPA: GIY-YIG nuclease family protein [Gemmatimonadaceae bacterium]|nr:GIY-YIG nuclease family protein [Gemmatimonadaceae bacterium]
MKQFYVYILSSESRTTYVGVTNDLIRRLWQHRNGHGSAFAQRYRITRLVHFEIYSDAYSAISREKELKAWRRSKKIDLIEQHNPDWLDRSADIGLPTDAGPLSGR